MPKPDFTQISIASNESKAVLIDLMRSGIDVKYGLNKIKVVGSDPRQGGDIPCIGVNIANKAMQGDSITQSGESRYDDDPTSPTYQKWLITRSTFFEETLEIRLWHTNADERDRLGPIIDGILFASIPYLTELGFVNIQLGNGRDEADSERFAEPMYWYTLSMRFWNPLIVETVTADSTIELIGVTTTP
jgi:hypothetical protein